MMKAGTCPLPREEHSLLVASLLPPRGIFQLTALSALPVLQPCHQRSPTLHEFPSLGHQISVICHRRVRVQWDPAAGLQFRAPIPSLFHVSAPVSSFASCCLRLLGARASRDAGPGPGLPARGGLQRRGEQAGAGTELPVLGRGWSSWRGSLWSGDAQTELWHREEPRTRLCAHGAECHRATVTPVPAGSSRGAEGSVPRIARPTERRGCPAPLDSTSALSAASHECDPGPEPRPPRLAPLAGRTDRGKGMPAAPGR